MSSSRMMIGALLMGLSAAVAAPAPAQGAEVLMNGYYRTRFRATSNLFLQQGVTANVVDREPGSDDKALYFDHRLRLEPEIRVNPYLSVYLQADIFDNRTWGSDPTLEPFSDLYQGSAGTSQTLSVPQSFDAQLAVKRAWAEIYTPIGRLRMGRTAHSTGMGLYFNDGNGWDADAGDTVDRVQFLTRLGPMYALVGYDQVFEGLKDHPYDGQALVAALAYRSELASASLYSYWQRDRSYPYVAGATLETTEAGGSAYEEATANDMLIGTWDLWTQANLGPVKIEAEGVLRYGRGDLVLLQSGAEAADQADGLGEVVYLQGGAAIRGRYQRDIETYGLEFGFASGDADDGNAESTDTKFTTFSFDRDYRVSLLMFRVPLPQGASNYSESGLTAGDITQTTGYSVSNAIYLRPNITARIMDGLTFDAAVLAGWTFAQNEANNNQKLYGYEAIGTLKYSLWERLDLRARGAVLLPGPAYSDVDRDIAHGERALAGEIQAFISF